MLGIGLDVRGTRRALVWCDVGFDVGGADKGLLVISLDVRGIGLGIYDVGLDVGGAALGRAHWLIT